MFLNKVHPRFAEGFTRCVTMSQPERGVSNERLKNCPALCSWWINCMVGPTDPAIRESGKKKTSLCRQVHRLGRNRKWKRSSQSNPPHPPSPPATPQTPERYVESKCIYQILLIESSTFRLAQTKAVLGFAISCPQLSSHPASQL